MTELLQSLTFQTYKDFEVIVVDDGSQNRLESVVNSFSNSLNIRYFYKENSGPAHSRNFGMKQADGNYFIFLDSDTIAPKTYVENVCKELNYNYVDAFGGPDAADASFNELQKAITFSMTSFLTTGGIRGGKKHVGKFQPRSFNMGISKKAFETTGGFGELRIGEDPDLSMTLWEKGFETRLFPQAKVYHKRRTSLAKFAKQVHQFGIARPILNQRHPNYTKITFWFPTIFTLGLMGSLAIFILSFFIEGNIKYGLAIPLFMYILYFQAIFLLASAQYDNFKVGTLAIYTTLIQFFNYGIGFFKSWISINILKENPKKRFPTHFSSDN